MLQFPVRVPPSQVALQVAACCIVLCATAGLGAALEPPQFVRAWGTNGTAPGQFISPTDLGIDPGGNVFVLDCAAPIFTRRVQVFDPNGNFLRAWQVPDICMAVDASGSVWGAATDGGAFSRIYAWSSAGTPLTDWMPWYCEPICTPTQNDCFTDIAVDPSGRLFVADPCLDGGPPDFHLGLIDVFTPATNSVEVWGHGLFASGPIQAAVDGQGNVYALDLAPTRVIVFTSQGVFLRAWEPQASAPGQVVDTRRMAVDAPGRVYVMDRGRDRIHIFDKDGSFLVGFGSSGTAPGQFNGPADVAVDHDGNIYVADGGNDRIQKFTYGPVSVQPETWSAMKQKYR